MLSSITVNGTRFQLKELFDMISYLDITRGFGLRELN
jgi:hypothetical protein